MYAKAQSHKLHDTLRLSKADCMHLQLQVKVQDGISSRLQGAFFEALLHKSGVCFLKSVGDLIKNFQSSAYKILPNLLSQKTENALFEREDLHSF